jgi:hypothetical protein
MPFASVSKTEAASLEEYFEKAKPSRSLLHSHIAQKNDRRKRDAYASLLQFDHFFDSDREKRRTAMIWWVFGLVVLSILSYLSDVGVVDLHNLRVPFLNASLLSVLILLAAAGILARMLWMKRRGRREQLEKRIRDLEGKLALFGSEK